MADPLEVASAFHRELDAAKAATHVNRIRYPAKNTLGLGAKDEARRRALKTPTARHLSVVRTTPQNKGPLGF